MRRYVGRVGVSTRGTQWCLQNICGETFKNDGRTKPKISTTKNPLNHNPFRNINRIIRTLCKEHLIMII